MSFLFGIGAVVGLYLILKGGSKLGLIKRIKNLFHGEVTDLVDRLEDPQKMLKSAIQKMEGEYQKGKDGLVEMLVNKKKIQREVKRQTAKIDQLKQDIKSFIDSEEEALPLIEVKRGRENVIREMNSQLEVQDKYIDTAKKKLQKLDNKIKITKSKKDILVARDNCAQVVKLLIKSIPEIDTEIIDRAEEKIQDKEFYNEALSEVSGEYVSDVKYSEETLNEYKELKKQIT